MCVCLEQGAIATVMCLDPPDFQPIKYYTFTNLAWWPIAVWKIGPILMKLGTVMQLGPPCVISK